MDKKFTKIVLSNIIEESKNRKYTKTFMYIHKKTIFIMITDGFQYFIISTNDMQKFKFHF